MMRSPKSIGAMLAIAVALMATAWICFDTAERYFLRQLANQNDGTLRLVSSGLDGALLRFDPIPALIADKRVVRQLLAEPSNNVLRAAANIELKRIVAEVAASDIYVMDDTGLTVAASNFDLERSFVGRNFNFRPYFAQAFSGRPARYFALGTTSLKRGYYFSAPVRNINNVSGVVAVKIEVDAFEENWKGNATKVIVSDDHGVIFMASEPGWLFKTLSPLTDQARRQIKTSRRYPVDKLEELDMHVEPSGIKGSVVREIGETGKRKIYLSNLQRTPAAGWTLHVLTPATAATGWAVTVTAVLLLAILLTALLAGIVLQRRKRMMRDIERQHRNQEELELRVEERTQDLHGANRRLREEVRERTNAEEQLRSAQRELVQAGKLAALGQMSAALSHELNQPLAAIKSYAENARAYLKLHKTDQAGENIGRISAMADRMAELGNHLRNFARKPKQKVDVVDLGEVFEAVSNIMGARLKESGACLDIKPLSERAMVMGGSVRLQQVIINLINNALDAMSGMPDQSVEISANAEKGNVTIAVRDHGPGIDQADIDQIFDPFFTTKDVNEGLGLGLSISFNIIQDFGGRLNVTNHADGGAVFTITLVDANAVRSAAE